MSTPLTPDQKQALRLLIAIRRIAKKRVESMDSLNHSISCIKKNHRSAIERGDLRAEALHKIDLDAAHEALLETDFKIITAGDLFLQVCKVCEEVQLPREVWLRALSVNEREWDTEKMDKYGKSLSGVVSVLNLENSASRKEFDISPLNWCATMAMFNAMDTSPKFGKFVHDAANEVFNGAFGDYRPPSLLERLGVHRG
jgi:hypothetical protein